MKGIAFGQFYPSDSLIHSLDPRTKVILSVLVIVASFLCKSFVSFCLLAVFSLLIPVVSKIPVRTILKAIKPVLFVMVFTLVLNIFWTTGDHLLFEWRRIHIYEEGLYGALFMLIRILALIIGSSVLLTYTTTPISLADGLEQLLAPLKKLHVPVHEFAMMMTIALRFIPTLIEETDKIIAAQKARGADFTSGSLGKRAKALIPILVPLFISAFRRADELATAMECRCYRGGEGRTKLYVLHYHAKDFLVMGVFLAAAAALVLLNRVDFLYTMA